MTQEEKPQSENNKPTEFPSEQQQAQDQKVMKVTFFRFVISLWKWLKNVLNLKEGVDQENTINGIIRDIDFKGYNVYILICSIFIASIGLNVNSTAVVIGAMLISPLMGPILGVGLSVGTNDFKLLKRSVRSFGVATGISILTSFIYFLITPLKEEQSELLARTTPTLLDAFVAIFGGLAGIIAGSRKEKSNVVPGVAIATALMPPLCTAGYGLATGNFHYFFGAFYLFLLNSIFISIATFVIVKYLGFPQKSFVNPKTESKVKLYIYTFILIVLIPSGFIFWNVIKESVFNTQVNRFISDNIRFEGAEVINERINYSDSVSTIELFVMGDPIPIEVEENLNIRLRSYGLSNTVLKIHQAKDNTQEIAGVLTEKVRSGILEDLYKKNADLLEEKNSYIKQLERRLARFEQDTIPFAALKKEVGIQYKDLEKFSFGFAFETDGEGVSYDTIPTFIASWKPEVEEEEMVEKQQNLSEWLEVRLKLDSVRVIRY